MIRDVSETLRKVLHDPAQMPANPELKKAEISLDRPPDTLPTASADSVVYLFLYDVRENTELRSNEPLIERKNGQAIIHPAPLRLSCSYLITVLSKETEALLHEQRVLGQALRVLSRHPAIPTDFLVGSLKGQDPLPPMVAVHADALKNISEFWTSIGSKLRPSLTLTVTISVPVFTDVTDFLVTTETVSTLALTSLPGKPPLPELVLSLGGRVLDSGGNGIEGAQVDLLDAGLRAFTGAEGRFELVRVPTGAQTLRAAATGFVTRSQPVSVPGLPGDYEITLLPL